MPLPTLTPEQRTAALEKAMQARQVRAEITKKLASGTMKPEDVLNKVDDPIIGRMKVESFIKAIPGFGKARAAMLMEKLGISESRRLQGLGSKQMQALKDVLK